LAQRARQLDVPVVRQFIKYGLVGALNTILTFVIYSAGVLLHLDYLAALMLGYLAGSLNSYWLNRRWTFRASNLAHSTTGTRFALVQASALLANLGLLYLFVHTLGVAKIPSQAILTVPVLTVTFYVNRVWSFAHTRTPRRRPLRGAIDSTGEHE
jgi:putative flippase GtrA